MPNNHYKLVCIATQANVPWFWTGLPGVGKTSILYALARELKVPIHIEIGAISEPSDIGGFPSINPETRYVERLPLRWAELLKDTNGIIVFDELPHSPPASQAGMLRVIFEARVGETELGPNVRRGAIGNPTDVAGGWDLNPALANRFCHIAWDMAGYHDSWLQGMTFGWQSQLEIPILPANWETRMPHWKALVSVFAGKIRAPLLLAIPASEHDRTGPWPSPRTWEMGARLLAASESFGEDVQLELLSGCVGPGAAGEFLSWLKAADLPDPETLLATPESFPKIKPGQEHIIYAILSGVLSAIANHPDDAARGTRWIQATKVLYQAALIAPDVAFGFVTPILLRQRPSFQVQAPKEVRDLFLQYGTDLGILTQPVTP